MAGTEPKNHLLLRAARRERTERTPVWLMRQAGRFDPEYQRIRERADLPLETVFRSADLCTEISLLPRRFGVDAIVFFQDILTPLAPMGAPFVYRPGPLLETPLRTRGDVEQLSPFDPADELPFVAETLRAVRAALAGELPVVGFAGAPLTLAAFLIEGQSPGAEAPNLRAMVHAAPEVLHALLDGLAAVTADYLRWQIDAGADVVQLFESAADLLTEAEYEQFAHPYHVRIFADLGRRVPAILFVKEQPFLSLMAASGADVLSVGKCADLAAARRHFGHKVAFQGNVDNQLLASAASAEQIDEAVWACIRAGRSAGHILNLSHGVLKCTPVQNVIRFIQAARAFPGSTPRQSLLTG